MFLQSAFILYFYGNLNTKDFILGVNIMQIQPINIQYNPPCFGAIYQTNKIKLTPKQNEVVNDIIKTLRKPLIRYNNQTPEQYFKSKKGIDFSIDSCNRNENSIYVEGWFNTKNSQDGIKYEKPFAIGVYSPEHKFKISDIKKGYKKEIGINLAQLLTIPAILIAGLIGLNAYKKSAPVQRKPLVENIDSIANKVHTALSDTTVVNLKILKSVKK